MLGDAPTIATFYNEDIADRVATFETQPRTPIRLRVQFDADSIFKSDGTLISLRRPTLLLSTTLRSIRSYRVVLPIPTASHASATEQVGRSMNGTRGRFG